MKIVYNLLNKKITKIFLIVFSPEGEDYYVDIDMSIGLILEESPDKVYYISTSDEDRESPIILLKKIDDNVYQYNDFDMRMKKWMNCNMEELYKNEWYDFSKHPDFIKIINSDIKFIELVIATNNSKSIPIGLKINFADDYILSLQGSDGNTIETKYFNKNNKEQVLSFLGEISYIDISLVRKL